MNECKNCKKQIPNNKKYCNAQCMAIDYRKYNLITNCNTCGKKIIHSKSIKKIFCPPECTYKSKKGIKRPEHAKKMKGRQGVNKGKKMPMAVREKLRGINS